MNPRPGLREHLGEASSDLEGEGGGGGDGGGGSEISPSNGEM